MLDRRCVMAFVTRCKMISMMPWEARSTLRPERIALDRSAIPSQFLVGRARNMCWNWRFCRMGWGADSKCWSWWLGQDGWALSVRFAVCTWSLVRNGLFGGWLLADTWTGRLEGARAPNERRSDMVRKIWQRKNQKPNCQNCNSNERVNWPNTRVWATQRLKFKINELGKESLSTMKLTLEASLSNAHLMAK